MRITVPLFIAFSLQVLTVQAKFDNPSKTDTVSQSLKEKFLKAVKIGPENYYLPAALPKVDSVLVRRLAIDARYKLKASESSVVKKFQENQVLASLLSNTGLYTAPVEQNVAKLTALLNSFRYAEDLRNQILVLNTLGVYFVKSGEPEKSVGYFLQSLQLMEQLKDKSSIAYLTMNLGGVFKLMGNYGQAVTYYEYSQKTNQELKKYTEAAALYAEIASVKGHQKKYAEAESLILKKGLPLSKWSKPGRMRCFAVLAEIYLAQNRLSEAKWYYLQENKIAAFLNDQQSQVTSLINIAQLKNTLGDQTQALHDFKEAEVLASQNRYLSSLVEIKGEIGDIYLKMGDYNLAGTAINEYSALKESMFKAVK